MSLLLLIAAAIGVWAYKSGRWRSFGFGDVTAIASALLSVQLLTRGEWLPALVGLSWAGGWLWHRWSAVPPPLSGRAMSAEEARGVLDLPPAADAAMIRAAHRRLIARVHPDVGGSAELSRRVTEARDALLAELKRGDSRAS